MVINQLFINSSSIYPFICLSRYLSTYLLIYITYISIHIPMYPSIIYTSIHVIYPSIHPCIYPFICSSPFLPSSVYLPTSSFLLLIWSLSNFYSLNGCVLAKVSLAFTSLFAKTWFFKTHNFMEYQWSLFSFSD